MSQDQDFLRRWSRLKREAAAAPAKKATAQNQPAEKKAAEEDPVPLPSLDSLTFESDFKAFMHAKVEETVKRAALKKLFADPRFNVMDGLDTYIDDYTRSDTIPAEMLERMARKSEKLLSSAADEALRGTEAPAQSGHDQSAHHDGAHHDGAHHDGAHHDGASNDGDRAQDPKAL